MKEWIKGKKEHVYDAYIFDIYTQEYQSPNSDAGGNFTLVESSNWINIVPITGDNEVILVKQFRFGTDSFTLEFPGGVVDDGEDPLIAAKRELAEETGAGNFEIIETGRSRPNPAFLNNTCFHYLATGVELIHSQKLDQNEEIEVIKVPIAEIDDMIKDGRIDHSLILTSWLYYKNQK